jgi:hypothetical protein
MSIVVRDTIKQSPQLSGTSSYTGAFSMREEGHTMLDGCNVTFEDTYLAPTRNLDDITVQGPTINQWHLLWSAVDFALDRTFQLDDEVALSFTVTSTCKWSKEVGMGGDGGQTSWSWMTVTIPAEAVNEPIVVVGTLRFLDKPFVLIDLIGGCTITFTNAHLDRRACALCKA